MEQTRGGRLDSVESYLRRMMPESSWGDMNTLYAACLLFNVRIQVMSTGGASLSRIYYPGLVDDESLPKIILGHILRNGQGWHYLSSLG